VRRSRFILEADPASPRIARERTRSALSAWGDAESRDTAVLLVSELVTNAVVHARSTVTVRLLVDEGCVTVEVDDASALPPSVRLPRADQPGGRGLHLLESLTDRWGVRPSATGKTVWFELTSGSSA
jgi:anti-sigma regulatory factor (Ser/Thr protein kinase)